MKNSELATHGTTAAYQLEGKSVSPKEYAVAYMREVLGETEEEIQRVVG